MDRLLPRAGRWTFEAVGEGDQGRVVPERIAPGKPQQNGRLERLHLTLLQDTAKPPARSLREQLERLRSFQRLYNEERPHQALGNDTPSQHYASRRFASTASCANPSYGPDHTIRRVRRNGEIRWQGNTVYISEALIGGMSASSENEHGVRTTSYGPIALGVIAHRSDRLRKPKRQARGLVDNARRVAHKPTGPATTDLNKTRNVLPMSSVRSCYPCRRLLRWGSRDVVMRVPSLHRTTPLPQPSPTRGEGADRVYRRLHSISPESTPPGTCAIAGPRYSHP